jgi:sugar O-acyltransferase (sialic acid O-acetyltransferase NeuD family)
MKRLLLIGAGSGSREVLLLVDRINRVKPEWEVIGFVDENPAMAGGKVDGLPVYGPDHELSGEIYVASGVMDPKARERLLLSHGEQRGFQLATLIAPDVILPRDFVTGPGTVIFAGVVVSFDVQLGKGALVNWGVALGHHLRAGDFVTILTYALITGGCRIGSHTVIGARATLNIKVSVGSNALIGVGTTVIQNVPDNKRILALPRIIETG